jgi:mRNA interferase MazF
MTGDTARRGDIWWADLPVPRGSEPGFARPVLVVQSDTFNASAIRTVIAVGVTSNLRLANVPGSVRLTRRQSGLPRESVINISQMITVDKSDLTTKVRRVSDGVMAEVDAAMRLVLDLIA